MTRISVSLTKILKITCHYSSFSLSMPVKHIYYIYKNRCAATKTTTERPKIAEIAGPSNINVCVNQKIKRKLMEPISKNPDLPFQHNTCKQSTTDIVDLESHTTDRKFICDLCSKAFMKKKGLR